METDTATRKELVAEINRLNKIINRKQVDRLSWKKIMGDRDLILGPGYWSNGHFALMNCIEKPKALLNLKSLVTREIESKMSSALFPEITRTQIAPSTGIESESKNSGKVIKIGESFFDPLYLKMLNRVVPSFTLKVPTSHKDSWICAHILDKDDNCVGILAPLNIRL
jgi:hypothetical protein